MLALALLPSFVTTKSISIDTAAAAARIAPVVNPGLRKAELAKLSNTKRRQFCNDSILPTPQLDVDATISGPIQVQNSNAQMAGNDLFANIEAWYLGINQEAADRIRQALEEGSRIGAFTNIKPYSPPEY